MEELIGTLTLKMHVEVGLRGREKLVHLNTWPCIPRYECEEVLAAFFTQNPHVERRQCQAHWVVSEYIGLPR